MTKGTPSMGKKSGKKNTIRCRRCGKPSYHIRKKKCSSCGFGKSAKLRSYNWQKKKRKFTTIIKKLIPKPKKKIVKKKAKE